jgi:hypothetical protein
MSFVVNNNNTNINTSNSTNHNNSIHPLPLLVS